MTGYRGRAKYDILTDKRTRGISKITKPAGMENAYRVVFYTRASG